MAVNCRNLKSIDCRFDFYQISDIRQLLFQLKLFSELKRLNLWLNFDHNEDEDNIDVNQLFSFELFKGFSNISHLTISFDLKTNLKDSILKEIDINLPKLQYLEIKDKFETTPEGVKQMADIFSRLSRLETLEIEVQIWSRV